MPSERAIATVSSRLASSTRMCSSTTPAGISLQVWRSVSAALYAGMTSTTLARPAPSGRAGRGTVRAVGGVSGVRDIVVIAALRRPPASPAREVPLPLLDVRRQAFLGVVALEQQLLQLALDRERGLERDL